MGLTMKVEPKMEECFSENLNVGDDVEVRWGVQDGGLLDIDVRVRFLHEISFRTHPPSLLSSGTRSNAAMNQCSLFSLPSVLCR